MPCNGQHGIAVWRCAQPSHRQPIIRAHTQALTQKLLRAKRKKAKGSKNKRPSKNDAIIAAAAAAAKQETALDQAR